MTIIGIIRLLLLGLWLGAAVFFIGVAQIAFGTLPSRELAGSIVGRSLAVINLAGLGIAVVLLLTSLIVPRMASKFWVWAERLMLLIIAVATAASQFVIAVWLEFTREQMGGRPIDEIAVDDPVRMQFNMLHEYSTYALAIAMVAGLIAFMIIAARRPAATTEVVTTTTPLPPTSRGTTNDPFDFSKEFVKK